jgi:fucose 4-O-acetylase-like acetyltransferase
MSKRVEYVDECKGLLIILVVLGHVVQELTPEGTNHPLFNCIYAFHMPCFMFLAGYLAYSTFSASNLKELAIGIADKTTTILLPYFTWPIFVHGLALKDEWNWDIWGKIWDLTIGWSPWWFLKYVFLYYLIYAIVLGVRNIMRLKANMVLDCAVYISVLVGFLILRGAIPSLDSYILYGIFFFIGVILSKHEPLRRLAMNKHVIFLAISIFLISVFKYDFDDRGFDNKLIKIVVSLSVITMFFSGFTSIQGDSIVRRALGRYGRGSLAIYVAHFSILGLIGNEPLQMDSLLLLILLVALSIVIIEFCFLIKILCGVSTHMKFLLYGGKISVLFGNRHLPKRVPPSLNVT